jgi:DMSO reductase family type II enzyme chaperone
VASGAWHKHLSVIAQQLPFQLSLPAGRPASNTASLQQGYVSTFEVGAGSPFCPLYEGSHRSGRMKLMEDLVRFYEHFGLITRTGDHPDHISAELEFMHYMAFKEAAAIANSSPAEDLRRAQRDFLQRHLCKWLPRLGTRLDSAQTVPEFYSPVIALAADFCWLDLNWLKREA